MEQSKRSSLNHMQTFYWVAKTGSYTRGAKAMSLPKSTVSQQIQALEARLGVRLIERTTRKLALTEIGRVFLVHCERVIAGAEEAEHAVTEYRAEPQGLLRVGVPVTFARTYLAPILPGFCRKYPRLKVELVIPGRMDPVENLLDVAIRAGRVADSSSILKKLGTIRQGIYATREYLRKQGSPASPAELPLHPIISVSRTAQGGVWHLTDKNGKREEVHFDPLLSVSDPVMAYEMASSGLGIAAMAETFAKANRQLVRVLPDWRPGDVELFAIYPARELTPMKVRVFLDELEANLKI